MYLLRDRAKHHQFFTTDIRGYFGRIPLTLKFSVCPTDMVAYYCIVTKFTIKNIFNSASENILTKSVQSSPHIQSCCCQLEQ